MVTKINENPEDSGAIPEQGQERAIAEGDPHQFMCKTKRLSDRTPGLVNWLWLVDVRVPLSCCGVRASG